MYYIDREGHRIKKTTSQDKFLKFVYTHTATRVLMRPLLLPAVSRLGGKLLNTKVSAVFAGLFARTHGIDLNKYEKQKFDSYNDFFTRKIKAEERPVNREDTVLISPCDGKVSAYPIHENGRFFTVLMMEVGALMVGKIWNYKKERCQVKRGEEKGRFEFGGSTVVLLLEPDKVLPDSDLIRNTLQGAETIVKMGERIGEVI